MSAFRHSLHALYAVGLTSVAVAAIVGTPYYALPLSERPHSDMHAVFKPGGVWGHGLGIVGSAMVLLLLLYSARKRRRFGLRFGRLSRWLDMHIFFGLIGPMLITLHTAMKFNGLVSISYFSMLTVVLSGVFGRYVYMQIPRDTRGHVLSLGESRRRIGEIQQRLRDWLPPDAVGGVERFVGAVGDHRAHGFAAVCRTLAHDVTLPWRTRRLRRFLSHGRQKVPERELRAVVRLAGTQSVLVRRIALLDSMTRMLHYWHVFHRPFAVLMVVIMFLHIAIVVALGYTWVF